MYEWPFWYWESIIHERRNEFWNDTVGRGATQTLFHWLQKQKEPWVIEVLHDLSLHWAVAVLICAAGEYISSSESRMINEVDAKQPFEQKYLHISSTLADLMQAYYMLASNGSQI